MNIKILEGKYAVCRLEREDMIPQWVNTKKFTAITRTEDELSIVCLDKDIPTNVKKEEGWRVLKIEGPLDFSMIGVIAKISSILAKENISIFVVSTFDTDYLLLKVENLEKAIEVLKNNRYNIV